MSIQDIINTTINVIQGCVNIAKNTIAGTVNGVVYVVTHFPEVLSGMWRVFLSSVQFGQFLMRLTFEALKYVALNFTQVLKGIFDIAIELVKHIPTVFKFVLYDIPKETILFLYNNLPAVANWFVRNLPDLIAHAVGVVIGFIYAPFKISADAISSGYHYVVGNDNVETVQIEPASKTLLPAYTHQSSATEKVPALEAKDNSLSNDQLVKCKM